MNFLKRFWGFLGGSTGIGYTGGDFYRNRGAAYSTTASGAVINEETVLTIPAFFHALRLYGQTLGSLSWDLIKLDDNGHKSIARDHPVHRLIHDEPNEFQLPSAFRETIIGHQIAYGNGYAYIERDGNFRPTALLPLLPDRTYPTRHNGELKFITYVNGRPEILEPYEVFHIAGFSTNGLSGVPLVRLMAESLGLTKAEEQFAASYFGNGCNFGGTVEVPGKLSDEARHNLLQSVNNNSGLANAFRWIFLEEGLKANPYTPDAEKAQLIQSRQYQLSDMSRIVGLAPHLLYDLSRSTNNNIEFQGIEATIYSWKPFSNKLCQEANRKLLYESEKGVYEASIDLKSLSQGSALEQAERDQLRFNTCSLTPNEIRAKDGLNPIEGGDQLFVNIATMPLNLVIEKALNDMAIAKAAAAAPIDDKPIQAAEQEGQDKAPAEPNENTPPQGNKLFDDGPVVPAADVEDANDIEPIRSLQPIIDDVVGRLIRRETKAVSNAVTKYADDAKAFQRWYSSYQPETHRHVAEALAPVALTIGNMTAQSRDVELLATTFSGRTTSDIQAIIASSPLDRAAVVQQTIDNWQKERATEFAKDIIGGTKCNQLKSEHSQLSPQQ